MFQEAPIEPLLPFCQPFTFQIPGVRKYTKAGISKDCQYVYFFDPERVLVHRLSVPRGPAVASITQLSSEVFNSGQRFKGTMISRVALSGQYMALSTSEKLEVFKIAIANPAHNTISTIFRRSNDGWQTTGLAILEQSSSLSVVIGQRKLGERSYEGRVLLFTVKLSQPRAQPAPVYHLYNVPRRDFPKNVDISADGTSILCRTQLSNTIIIWKISGGSDQPAFQLTRNCYTPVSVLVSI